ncbi:MAG: hypothetical protein HY923_06970 [Elusimicrobia bacterium]|nr:hypothetical protein [Elusimicrobiota bacterium]
MSLLSLVLLLVRTASAGELEDGAGKAAKLAAAAKPSYVVDKALGAWYRKVVGPEGDDYEGLVTWGILPRPEFDPAREHATSPGEETHKSGPLDRPDIYLGLHAAGAEVDAGLIWDHVYDRAGKDTGKFAYRVYWRTSKGGWNNPGTTAANNIYLNPGDGFVMTMLVLPDGQAQLSVSGTGKGAASEAYTFDVPGLRDAAGKLKPLSFKRIHSIDQFRLVDGKRTGNENHPALPTKTRLTGGRWSGASLIAAGGKRRSPLAGSLATVHRGADAASHYAAIFPGASVGERGEEEMAVLPPRP